jgi:hypothetical protein
MGNHFEISNKIAGCTYVYGGLVQVSCIVCRYPVQSGIDFVCGEKSGDTKSTSGIDVHILKLEY